jgi:hypothetical protein
MRVHLIVSNLPGSSKQLVLTLLAIAPAAIGGGGSWPIAVLMIPR